MKDYDYILKVDNPCSEDWSSMTANAGGKYCSSCSKNVIDFTQLTDKQIIQLLNQNSGHLCGRFKKNQLNRSLIQIPDKSSSSPWYRLVAGFLLLFTSANSNASERKVETEIVAAYGEENISETNNYADQNLLQSDSLKHTIGILVKDSLGKAIKGASVANEELSFLGSTDVNGLVKITVPDDMLGNLIYIIVYHSDYESISFTVAPKELPIALKKVILPKKIIQNVGNEEMIMGGLMPSPNIERK